MVSAWDWQPLLVLLGALPVLLSLAQGGLRAGVWTVAGAILIVATVVSARVGLAVEPGVARATRSVFGIPYWTRRTSASDLLPGVELTPRGWDDAYPSLVLPAASQGGEVAIVELSRPELVELGEIATELFWRAERPDTLVSRRRGRSGPGWRR